MDRLYLVEKYELTALYVFTYRTLYFHPVRIDSSIRMHHHGIQHYQHIQLLIDRIQHLDYRDISFRLDSSDNEIHMNKMPMLQFYYK